MDLICFNDNIDNMTYSIDCNLIIYSQSKMSAVYIDYGDCSNEILNTENGKNNFYVLNNFFFNKY